MGKEKKAPEEKKGEKGQAQEEQKQAQPVRQSMFSKLGLIVYGATVLLICLLFGVMAYMMKQAPGSIPDTPKPTAKEGAKEMPQPKIVMTGADGIVVSVPMDTGASEFRHLKVSFVLTVGAMEDENFEEFNLDEAMAKEGFLILFDTLKPYVRDIGITLLRRYSYLQLLQPTYQVEFKDDLRDAVNDLLDQYGKKRRVKKVLLHDFIFSD